jgi:hypothetical protein
MCYRVVQSGDGTDVTFTIDSSVWSLATVAEFAGIDTDNPIMAQIDDTEESSGTSLTFNEAEFTDTPPAVILAGVGLDANAVAVTSPELSVIQESIGGLSLALLYRIVTSQIIPTPTLNWTNSQDYYGHLVALRAAASPIVRWQEVNDEGTGTAVSASLPQTPEPGHVALAIIGATRNGALTLTGPSGWTEITDAQNLDYIDSGSLVGLYRVFYRILVAGDSAEVSATLSASTPWSMSVLEYEGLGIPKITASTDEETTASELALDAFSLANDISDSLMLLSGAAFQQSTKNYSSVDDGFLLVHNVDSSTAGGTILTVVERIVNLKGTHEPDLTYDGNLWAAGALLAIGAAGGTDGISGTGTGGASRIAIALRIGL